jgi:hypothetical protein
MLKKGFTRLTNEALAHLASATIKLVTDTEKKTFTENELFLAIFEAYKPFNQVLNKATYSGMGTQIADEDGRRDNMYLGLKEVVTGMNRFSKEISKYADTEKLLFVFKKHGNMSKKTYTQQSAALTAFCDEMATTENAAIIESLGLTDMFARLRNMNTHFKNTYLEQVSANADLRQKDTAVVKRKPLEDALKQFYTLVEAMKNTASWDKLYADLSELSQRNKF